MYPPSSSPSSLPTKCCTCPSSSPPMTKSKNGLHTPSAANQSRKKATLPQPSKKVVIKLNKGSPHAISNFEYLHKGRGITSSLLQGKGTNLDTRQESTCDIRRQQPIPRSRVDVWVKIHRFDSGGTKTKRRDRACDTKKQRHVISFLVSAQYQLCRRLHYRLYHRLRHHLRRHFRVVSVVSVVSASSLSLSPHRLRRLRIVSIVVSASSQSSQSSQNLIVLQFRVSASMYLQGIIIQL
ncbi:hypothetical protein F2Q70_00001789 [Brassica cretica]|uniref:Uncharacterized protein n=1 Tax=Brassica cretica TaxID=69181 RepID=A0A8S9J4C7_BRACR|nr:hypothetical protein F2Q70_00001789 [Brassica cretica]